ncbi:putative uncharacterized protein encoded by LINC01590 isoform X1 [Macaca nemestrina]|uniref:putative uncharacterized protein encoded by LINC01590 isoform X1 n=1 Tax=Macaca nemestrina TaxID=9545 RepID=UPI0039B924F9
MEHLEGIVWCYSSKNLQQTPLVFFQFPAPHPPTVLRPQLGLDPNPKYDRGKMSVRDHDPEVPTRNSGCENLMLRSLISPLTDSCNG